MKRALTLGLILLATPIYAQDQTWSRDAAMKDLRELVLKKTPMNTWAQRKKDVTAWLARVEEAKFDFAEHSYMIAIARYFSGDYGRAGEDMATYLTQHPKLPTRDFDMIAGRIMMGHAIGAIREKRLGVARSAIPHAADLYSNPLTIYRAVARQLLSLDGEAHTKLLNEVLTRAFIDKRMTDADKQQLLIDLYAPKRRASGGAARGKASTGPKPLKPFEGKDLDGKAIRMEQYKGKVLLVDFWATWCGPCMREMPNVVAAYERFHEAGFEVVGISLDKEKGQERGGPILAPKSDSPMLAKIRAVMKEASMTWPCIYEGGFWETRLAKANGVRSIPATFLLDRNGKVRYTNLRGEALMEKVKELIAEKAGASKRERR